MKKTVVLLFFFCNLQLFAQEARVVSNINFSFPMTYKYVNSESPFFTTNDEHDFSTNTLASGNLKMIIPYVQLSSSFYVNLPNFQAFNAGINTLFLKFSPALGWGVNIGRFRLNWSDGAMWNVSDVVNNRVADDVITGDSGKDAIEILGGFSLFSLAIDINMATSFDFDNINDTHMPIYIALGTILYPLEVRLKFAYADTVPYYGYAMKYSNDYFNLFVDGIFLQGDFIRDKFNYTAPDFAWRQSIGFSFVRSLTNLHSISFSTEYLHQTDGLTKSMGKNTFKSITTNVGTNNDIGLLLGNYAFDFYKNYIYADFGYSYSYFFGTSASLLFNIEDLSGIASISASYTTKYKIQLYSSLAYAFGDTYTEGGSMLQKVQVRLGISRNFNL